VTTEHDSATNERGKLRLLQVDKLTLALRDEEVLTVVEWTEPTPLPFAPASVLGVVSVQGRMFTVLDLGLLLDNEATEQEHRFIAALRGDEQLALAVADSKSVGIRTEKITPDTVSSLIRGKIQLDNQEVSLLNVDMLFAVAIRGRERRRRRL
jgi:chemotaxis signal transduction protein